MCFGAAPPYFMFAGLFEKADVFCSQMQKSLKFFFFFLNIKWKISLQHAMFSHHFQRYFGSSSVVVLRIVSEAVFLARACILMFPFENYRASAPRLLSEASKTAVPGLQPRGLSKIHTVKINLRAFHPSAGLTLTL